ncbi:MAG: YkvA family protein [Gemmatimonadota bacterium]|nr:YkvA family protein [Gemmatimonadota bacterium]
MTAARRSTGRAKRATIAIDPREAKTPRAGLKRTVLGTIRHLPAYVRLLFGLMTDRRVSFVDKLLVGGAIAYIISPLDLIPDFIPFLGEVDDVYFLMLALQRLTANAGRKVLVDHWSGDPDELSDLSFQRVFSAAAFFLPRSIRRQLNRMGKKRDA